MATESVPSQFGQDVAPGSNAAIGSVSTVMALPGSLSFNTAGTYVVNQGPKNYTQVVQTTQAYPSGNSIVGQTTWNLAIPNNGTAISRQMFMRVQVEMVFHATTLGANGQSIDINGYDAFQTLPFSQTIDNTQLWLNDQNITLRTAEVLNPLLRYGLTQEVLSAWNPFTPIALDRHQDYDDANNLTYPQNAQIAGAFMDPLQSYGNTDSAHRVPRGAFQYDTIEYDYLVAGDVRVVATLLEPLIISPFDLSTSDDHALIGVQQLQLTITNSNITRMWSHNEDNANSSKTLTFTCKYVKNPEMLITFLTPPDGMAIPETVLYPYSNLDTYLNAASTATPCVRQQATGAPPVVGSNTVTFTSPTFRLGSIPNAILIWAAEKEDPATAHIRTKSYMQLTNIKVQFDNQSDLLANSTPEDLFMQSWKGGATSSWIEWTRGAGSPFILVPGLNLQMDSREDAPGMTDPAGKMINFTATFKNTSFNRDIAIPTLNIIMIYNGFMTISNGSCVLYKTPLTPASIASAQAKPAEIQAPLSSFYSGTGTRAKKTNHVLMGRGFGKKLLKFGKSAARLGAAAGIPGAGAAGELLSLIPSGRGYAPRGYLQGQGMMY